MEIERYQLHKHPLTLCEIEGVDGPHCLVCDMGSFLDGYNCSNCEFHLHRQCLSLKPNIKYQAHQHDLLTLLQNNDKSYKSQCHACGFDIKSIFFVQCLECRLNFHVRCGSASASLPQVAQHKNHSHPLSLVTNESKALVKDDSILLYCNDCKEEIDPMAVLNQYNTHVRCVITETQLGERERYKHFSHRHLLVLLESKKSKCYACKRLNIQGKPAYGCDLCGFYLHQSCFELQKVIYLHQSHLHYLTLRDSSNSGKRVCKARGKHLNGLIYHCASCDFNLDLDCASQRPSMKKWKVWGDYESKYRV
ncbi:uncharacterized protein LOC112099911 [Citrus clementina]|uniref:uncharacterized protein LOC112099911 n=1 Tax=Citrus clementina TaxID=85681 RepID=UPI000CED534E|nr:uncharacterized protein LOC112099911 [Citrus x clementina]